MADILIATQATPQSACDGGAIFYVDSTSKELCEMNDLGIARCVRPLTNANTGDVSAAAANTYLTGSSITIPTQGLKVGSTFRWRFILNRASNQTGTAAPVWTVTFGTNGSTADTARVTFTANAQTSASQADTGYCDIMVNVLNTGGLGILGGTFFFTHTRATDSLNNAQWNILLAQSATFDMTVASSIIGVACNPGASSTWTFNQITAEALGI